MRKMNDYRRFLTFVFLLMISGSAALAQELMKVAGLVVDQKCRPFDWCYRACAGRQQGWYCN